MGVLRRFEIYLTGLGVYTFFICVMFGYDSLAGNIVVSIAQFRKDFGYEYGGDYVVSADWQLAFQGATLGGMLISSSQNFISFPDFCTRSCLWWLDYWSGREQMGSTDLHLRWIFVYHRRSLPTVLFDHHSSVFRSKAFDRSSSGLFRHGSSNLRL